MFRCFNAANLPPLSHITISKHTLPCALLQKHVDSTPTLGNAIGSPAGGFLKFLPRISFCPPSDESGMSPLPRNCKLNKFPSKYVETSFLAQVNLLQDEQT